MKISHLLEAPSSLEAFISKNSHLFQSVGSVHVFIWTDQILRSLIKAGAKSNKDLRTVSVPNEIGLGLVNVTTGELCVGAIDPDYEALWASSSDVSDFFVATGNKKLIRLPNRLQNLADMLNRSDNPQASGGVDAIVDYIEEEGWDKIDVEAIRNMTSTDEVRQYLEGERDHAQQDLGNFEATKKEMVSKANSLWGAGDEDGALKIMNDIKTLRGDKSTVMSQSEDILKQRHLFVEPDSDTGNSDDSAEIDKWTSNFNRDFPDLDLPDAREFAPQ